MNLAASAGGSGALLAMLLVSPLLLAGDQGDKGGPGENLVRARVQTRPGGPLVDAEMKVHAAPVDPPMVRAEDASLDDGELVLGLALDGQAAAYPIRYLALYEIVNDRIGQTPIAPSW